MRTTTASAPTARMARRRFFASAENFWSILKNTCSPKPGLSQTKPRHAARMIHSNLDKGVCLLPGAKGYLLTTPSPRFKTAAPGRLL